MNAAQDRFFANTVGAAQASQRVYGVPASVTIAQAIVESGWGQSVLATKYHNYFGIKAAVSAAPESYVEFPTTEFVDGRKVSMLARFARYPSPSLGFAAHARLLATARRYQPAMAECADPAAFADMLALCGYSTDPNYGARLMELVREYDLTQYDAPPQGDPAQAQEVA